MFMVTNYQIKLIQKQVIKEVKPILLDVCIQLGDLNIYKFINYNYPTTGTLSIGSISLIDLGALLL